jgi:hypothetical protein
MGVLRTRQDEGIGMDLKERALDVCTGAGATIVRSSVHRMNSRMRRVNAKLGIAKTIDPTDGKHFLYAARIVPAPDD